MLPCKMCSFCNLQLRHQDVQFSQPSNLSWRDESIPYSYMFKKTTKICSFMLDLRNQKMHASLFLPIIYIYINTTICMYVCMCVYVLCIFMYIYVYYVYIHRYMFDVRQRLLISNMTIKINHVNVNQIKHDNQNFNTFDNHRGLWCDRSKIARMLAHSNLYEITRQIASNQEGGLSIRH